MEADNKESDAGNQPPACTHQSQTTRIYEHQAADDKWQPYHVYPDEGNQEPICANQSQKTHINQILAADDYKFQTTSLNTPSPGSETIVVTQPTPVTKVVMETIPLDYLLPSILACCCCFWPTGACAIIHSLKVISYKADGDIKAARAASNKALMLIMASIAFPVTFVVFMVVSLSVHRRL